MSDPRIDHDYDVRATVSEDVFERVIDDYRTGSERATTGLSGHAAIAYDDRSDECLDVWGVGGRLRPAVVAIHGGYWRRLSRHDTAFMARVLEDAGIATVAVDYTLAPAATLEEIVRQVRASIAWVYHRGAEHGLDPDRIFVTGSSAGGHLTATTMTGGEWLADLGLPPDVVKGALPISGLFDLRPLARSFANEWLSLDVARAAALSPQLSQVPSGPQAVIAVAENDGAGFLAQSHRFHETWAAHSSSRLVVVPDRNHYDVFLDLSDPKSSLTRALVDMVHSFDRDA